MTDGSCPNCGEPGVLDGHYVPSVGHDTPPEDAITPYYVCSHRTLRMSDYFGFDVARHPHGFRANEPVTGYFHTHPWGSVPHSHMLRAICNEPECEGFATHNIHEGPRTGRESDGS